MARALAAAAAPLQAADLPPSWLLAEQVASFRRVLAALRVHGGALLADPPGSGKTWVALAAAARWSDEPATCLVPAAVAPQWRRTANGLGVNVRIVTHQAASRGRLPPPAGLVVIDESHHLRNTTIRRYGHVARWLVGRQGLLLSATPAVNRLDDLTHQLALVLRDDALALQGIASIRGCGALKTLPPSFAAVVIAGRPARDSLPVRRERLLRHRMAPELATLLTRVDRLALSSDASIAALVRGVLIRAGASSPAALAAALRRYRLLLLHARDARSDGRMLGRSALRRWVGPMADQTVLWPLVSDCEPGELALDDLESVESIAAAAQRLAACPRDDPKVAQLRALVADGRRSIVFTWACETVADLRRRLPSAAWCTGAAAGVGRLRAKRHAVLGAFGPGTPEGIGTRVLIATDVAAEGLDLHGASRVVHYDLPWTAMRLEQRAGRATRRGSRHAEVEVVRFLPPRALECRLGASRAIEAKAALPARAGLGPGDPLAAWRVMLDEAAHAGPGTRGVAWLGSGSGDVSGVLAGIELRVIGDRPDAGGVCGPATLLWIPEGGPATTDPEVVGGVLRAALARDAPGDPVPGDIERVLRWVDGPARQLLRLANGARWSAAGTPSARHAARRIARLGRNAARLRDGVLLAAVDEAAASLGGGLTAGEQLCVDALATRDDRALLEGLRALPRRPPPAVMEARLAGLIIVRG